MMLHSLTHATKTLGLLNKQRVAKNFTDFNVCVGEEIFCVHRSLLAAHSPLLKRALESLELNQDPSATINLSGVDANIFSILVDFLYTATLDVNRTNVNQVCSTAKSLEIEAVVELCKDFDRTGGKEDETHEKSYQSHNYTQFVEVIDGEEKMPNDGGSQKEIGDFAAVKEGADFESQDGVKRGRKPAVRVECPLCGKQMTESRLRSHYRLHSGEKSTTCQTCHKSFANIYNLRIHERQHTGEKPYQCELCPRSFADPSSLCKHKLWHSGVKRHKCDQCGKSFSTRAHIVEHMRTHTRERPFVCPQCGRSFSFRCDLSRHLKEHNGDLLGPCQYCGRTFTHTGNYKAHLRAHRKKLGLEPKEPTDEVNTLVLTGNDDSDQMSEQLTRLVESGEAIEIVIDDV